MGSEVELKKQATALFVAGLSVRTGIYWKSRWPAVIIS
jgi:hypothetical protein